MVVRLGYFVAVGGGAAFVLWRSWRLTSVYNVDSKWIFVALEEAYRRLGLDPLRFGDSFLIDDEKMLEQEAVLEADPTAVALLNPTGSAPSEPPGLSRRVQPAGINPAVRLSSLRAGLGSTTLQVDVFPLMRHATLRWEPADSPLRREVEKELSRLLVDAPPPDEDSILSGCLTLLGVSLFAFTCLSVGFLVLLRFLAMR